MRASCEDHITYVKDLERTSGNCSARSIYSDSCWVKWLGQRHRVSCGQSRAEHSTAPPSHFAHRTGPAMMMSSPVHPPCGPRLYILSGSDSWSRDPCEITHQISAPAKAMKNSDSDPCKNKIK